MTGNRSSLGIFGDGKQGRGEDDDYVYDDIYKYHDISLSVMVVTPIARLESDPLRQTEFIHNSQSGETTTLSHQGSQIQFF